MKIKYTEAMIWKNGRFYLLDQTLLPARKKYIEIKSKRDIWVAIRELKVRGAPAIGVAAAFGVAIWMKKFIKSDVHAFLKEFDKTIETIRKSRPTAVNLSWALERMKNIIPLHPFVSVREWINLLLKEAESIYHAEREVCENLGKYGEKLIKDGDTIMTHCNAGALATPGLGTALAVVYHAVQNGKKIKMFVPETRPLLQGARLTAWELCSANIPTTLICDSATGSLLRSSKINIIFVGADRIAINGDVANKIGTYNLAVLAHENHVPFYVVAPISTFDSNSLTGDDIVIEERAHKEVSAPFGRYWTTRKADVYNPAFDVTPASYINGIVTEKGIIHPPFKKNINRLLKF